MQNYNEISAQSGLRGVAFKHLARNQIWPPHFYDTVYPTEYNQPKVDFIATLPWNFHSLSKGLFIWANLLHLPDPGLAIDISPSYRIPLKS